MADVAKSGLEKYLPYITAGAGLGLTALGAHKASGAVNQQNDRVQQSQDQLYQLAKQEQAKKEQLTQQFMPQIQQGFRQRPMPQMGAQYGQIGSQPMGQGQPAAGPSYQPVNPGASGLSKASGLIGAAASFAPGVGQIAGPVMMGIGAISSQFGKGHRTADEWVKQQNAFDQRMAQLPDSSPQEQSEMQAYLSAIEQMKQGDKSQQKVGQGAYDTAKKYYPGYF